MIEKNQVVEYRRYRQWTIRREDSTKVTKIVYTQDEAILIARVRAQKNKSILSIFDKFKRPRRIENYSVDPYKLTIPKYR